MFLIVSRDQEVLAEISLRTGVTIGADFECHVVLDDPRVPAEAVRIERDGDGWQIEWMAPDAPLRSAAGPVRASAPLSIGDELQLFDYVLHCVAPPEDEQPDCGDRTAGVEQLTRFVQSTLPPGAILRRLDENVELAGARLGDFGAAAVKLSCADAIPGVMDAALDVLVSICSARNAWIGVRRVNYGPMEYVQGRTRDGASIELPAIGVALQARVLHRSQFVFVPRVREHHGASVLQGPLPGPRGMLGMLYIDSGSAEHRFDERDVDFFVLIALQIAAQLDAVIQQAARNRGALVAGEVGVAHAIQGRITPRKLPQWDTLSCGAFREVGTGHSGDVYDVVRLGDGRCGVLIARAPSSGATPSLLMAQAQAAFRVGAMHLDPPHVLLTSLNILMYDGQPDRVLDCLVAFIDPSSGELTFAAAGDIEAWIVSARGEERPLVAGPRPPRLGSAKLHQYSAQRTTLGAQETLALFTAGAIAACNRRQEAFGAERFMNGLCDAFGQPASSALQELVQELRAFTEGLAQRDDLTIVLAHYNP